MVKAPVGWIPNETMASEYGAIKHATDGWMIPVAWEQWIVLRHKEEVAAKAAEDLLKTTCGDALPSFGWCNVCKSYCYGDCEA
jgi:hypothetical protein